MEVKMPENAGVFSESESAGVFRILTWSEEDFESSDQGLLSHLLLFLLLLKQIRVPPTEILCYGLKMSSNCFL